MIASIPHLLRDHFSGGFCLNGLSHECPLIVAWIRQVLRYNKIDLTFWQNKLDKLSAFFIFAGDIGRCLMNTRIDVSEILRIGFEVPCRSISSISVNAWPNKLRHTPSDSESGNINSIFSDKDGDFLTSMPSFSRSF